jgi:hypothetical protein
MHAAILLTVILAVPAGPAAAPRAFGKALQGLPPAKLADVLARPEAGRAVRLEGTIEKVCQNKGCWITLRQGEQSVHVTFEGYSFFLPRDSAARPAVLEGKVVVETPKAEHVEHLKSEGAGAAAAGRVSVEAYGVQVR